MNRSYEEMKEELKAVIVETCKRIGIDPSDHRAVMSNAMTIWSDLVASRKLTEGMIFEGFMQGLGFAAMKKEMENGRPF